MLPTLLSLRWLHRQKSPKAMAISLSSSSWTMSTWIHRGEGRGKGKGSWAHPSPATSPCRSDTPQTTVGWQGCTLNGVGHVGQRNPSHTHVWISSWHWMSMADSVTFLCVNFFPFPAIWRRFYLPFPHPSRHPMPVPLKPAFRVSVLVRD